MEKKKGKTPQVLKSWISSILIYFFKLFKECTFKITIVIVQLVCCQYLLIDKFTLSFATSMWKAFKDNAYLTCVEHTLSAWE